ncbi:MAG: AMIN domain-containing protein [Bdellovibrionales bacterium]|nr:AMIN domain-containing protein [Bdellovibrionales bacterium]
MRFFRHSLFSLLLVFPLSGYAETFLGKTKNDVSVFLERRDSQSSEPLKETLRVTYQGTNHAQPKVFYVPHPHRLVIDITGVQSTDNLTLPISQPSSLSQIRIGAHPDKVRIVLDISGNELPSYTFEDSEDELQLTLSSGNPLKNSVSKTDKTQAPEILALHRKSSPKKETTPALEPAVENSELASLHTPDLLRSQPSKAPIPSSATTRQDSEPTPDGPLITHLGFQYLEQDKERAPVIVLSLTTRPNFSVRQEKAGVYKVFVKGHKLGSQRLKLPFFPPHDFEGINGMQLSESKKGVTLTLMLDPGSKLTSFTKGKEIFLRREAPQGANAQHSPPEVKG